MLRYLQHLVSLVLMFCFALCIADTKQAAAAQPFDGYRHLLQKSILSPPISEKLTVFFPITASTTPQPDTYSNGLLHEESIADPANESVLDALVAGTALGTLFGYPFTGLGVADAGLAALCLFGVLKIILYLGLQHRQEDDLFPDAPDDEDTLVEMRRHAASAWERLRSTPAPEQQQKSLATINTQALLPHDFDASDFLEGAKLLYARLQVAWAARDITELEPFITPEMLQVLTQQAEATPTATELEVVLVSPTLLDVSRYEQEERAKVLFRALLQEEGNATSFEVSEIWYFTHDYVNGTSWQLDGIEQVNNESST